MDSVHKPGNITENIKYHPTKRGKNYVNWQIQKAMLALGKKWEKNSARALGLGNTKIDKEICCYQKIMVTKDF